MSFGLSEDQVAIRDMAAGFAAEQIAPHALDWDERKHFPVETLRAAAGLGMAAITVREDVGGSGLSRVDSSLIFEALSTACPTVAAFLSIHNLTAWILDRFGSEEQRRAWLPALARMDRIASYCLTEPGGGSDVANLRTKARRDGDHYVVSGEKTFITSGMRADYLTVAVRTGGEGPGGVSLLLIEGDTPGLSRTKLKKMGWWASDTATLHFDECRVPVENLIGEEGRGFKQIMYNFNSERMGMAASCTAYARVCLDEAIGYAKERKTFGKPIAQHQVIRHKIVDMAQKVAVSQAMLEMLAWRLGQGESPVAEICMMKNQATQTMAHCASEAVQIFGGAGFMRGIKVERIYREVKVNAIGGGTEEIMKDLASRQMGL